VGEALGEGDGLMAGVGFGSMEGVTAGDVAGSVFVPGQPVEMIVTPISITRAGNTLYLFKTPSIAGK
jgi:hypothetical protein